MTKMLVKTRLMACKRVSMFTSYFTDTYTSRRHMIVPMIALTRAWDADRVAEEIGAAHRVILSDPRCDALFAGIRQEGDHLHLAFHDVVEPAPDRVLANEEQVLTLIDFARTWGIERPLVVNCYGGRSRSPAALSIILASLNPGREHEIIEMITTKAPHAAPNRHVISLGDRLLGCRGALIAAVEAMPIPVRGFTGTAFFDVKRLAKAV